MSDMKTPEPIEPSDRVSQERQPDPKQTIKASGGSVIQNVKQTITTVYNQFDDKLFSKLRLELRLFFVLLVLAVIGLAIYLINRSRLPDDGGLFTIAVAGFTEIGQFEKSGIGISLASEVHDALNKEFSQKEVEALYPKILPLKDVSPIAGYNDEEVNRSAQNAAKECHAHLLVYGSVKEIDLNRWEISPQFWVDLENAHELEGQHKFGKPFEVEAFSRENAKFQPRAKVRLEFSKRTWSFAKIAAGLMHYDKRDYIMALECFESIEENEAWEYIEGEGKELLYVFLGNTAGKLKRYNSAEQYFKDALECDNECSRASLGLADIYINRAAEDDKTVDDRYRWLGEAFNNYKKLLKTENETSYPYLTTKINFGLGRCYFLRGFLSLNSDDFDQAISNLEAVIDAYDNGKDEEIRELASQAHGLLGRIYFQSQHPERARHEYEDAKCLTKDNSRRSLYEERISDLEN
jgi:tetratricopeptide (TPR) repeat protein